MISVFFVLFFCVLAAIYITGRTVHVVYPGGGEERRRRRRLVGESSGALSAPKHTCPGWLFCFLCFNLLWSVVFVALSIFSLSLSLSPTEEDIPAGRARTNYALCRNDRESEHARNVPEGESSRSKMKAQKEKKKKERKKLPQRAMSRGPCQLSRDNRRRLATPNMCSYSEGKDGVSLVRRTAIQSA